MNTHTHARAHNACEGYCVLSVYYTVNTKVNMANIKYTVH